MCNYNDGKNTREKISTTTSDYVVNMKLPLRKTFD